VELGAKSELQNGETGVLLTRLRKQINFGQGEGSGVPHPD
jgi:hypothetical protein